MPFRKIPDPPPGHWGNQTKPCLSPEHNPPTMIVLEPGRWEYTCPACGKVEIIVVAAFRAAAEAPALTRKALGKRDCPQCNGLGDVGPTKRCARCDGSGKE